MSAAILCSTACVCVVIKAGVLHVSYVMSQLFFLLFICKEQTGIAGI